MIGAVVLLTVIAVTSLWLYFFRNKNLEKKIPGLEPTSQEDGNLSDMREAGGFQEFLEKLHAQLGPIASFWYGQVYTVSIASPELFKQHMHPFDRPVVFFKIFEALVGPASIQFTNGEDGRLRRKIYDRAFAHGNFDSYFKTFQQCADVTVKQWSAKEEDNVIPLSDETFRFAVRSAMCSILGTYCEDEEVISGFIQAYREAQDELAKVLSNPDDYEKAHTKQPFNEALEFMRKTVRSAVEHHRKTTSQGNLVIDRILEYTSDEDIILSDSLTYLIGSFHNTGNMLASGLFYLAKNEDVQERLYNEIIQVLGEDGRVDGTNIKDLKYMRQVIDEAIRCGSFGTFAVRHQDTDITLGGFKIPKNTPVIQAVGTVMRDEKIWSKPTEFDPNHFNDENTKNRSSFAFKPFGFSGKRVCPGYKFVHPKSAVFLATVLKRFKIKPHGKQQIEFEHGFSTHSKEEMWAKLVKR